MMDNNNDVGGDIICSYYLAVSKPLVAGSYFTFLHARRCYWTILNWKICSSGSLRFL